ncbi:MAG: SDR family oxidoreductase [Deltaproteobacteria bacterium]|nr:SDR family oxidoreductase [Deltaproteobacteria bacterium]
MRRLEGKVAIVTGASRGIGRAVALAFAREGAAVVIAAKSDSPSPRLPGTIHTVADEVRALGARALAVKVDVRDDGDVDRMAAETVAAFGRIDVLVNNAGALWWRPVVETPMKRYDLVQGINARGSFTCTRAVLPHMVAGGGGHVVMYSPPVDTSAMAGRVAYCMSKFGMTLFAIGLAAEMRGRHVAANALWPVTLIESQATINFGLGGPKMWRKADILADATVEIVASSPDELTGQALLDEDFLRSRGWTDFTRYRCDPEHEPPRFSLGEV